MWEKRVEPNSGTAHVAKCFPILYSRSSRQISKVLNENYQICALQKHHNIHIITTKALKINVKLTSLCE